jgi:anthranilate synthase component I
MNFPLTTQYHKRLADTFTPVSLYLRLRDHFSYPLLLESSDYHGDENPLSYLCLEPMATFRVQGGTVQQRFPDGSEENYLLEDTRQLPQILQGFIDRFEVKQPEEVPFSANGLFGYQGYDVVRHYETVDIDSYPESSREIPDLLYHVYRYVLVINHFHNELYLFEHRYGDEPSQIDRLDQLINRQALPRYSFTTAGRESTNFTDDEFLQIIDRGRHHCQLGDVFQIVLSRQFSQRFHGDEFNVYRALRSVNPSPYLFYCDFGDFKLMGSSPEAQLIIADGQATIHPIAGTFRRTGNDEQDSALARELSDDPKENAEHVMLVDLARNDLSRHGSEVQVETYKEVQYYSHVIHLVSKVTAQVREGVSPLQLVADTFPAGTLSGAPKHKAMQLIELYENQNRGFYGGAIGFLGFDGSFNHAIMIRSFLSKNNVLCYQAGAGVVSQSDPQKELQEVNNKLAALRTAIDLADEGKQSKTATLREARSETASL